MLKIKNLKIDKNSTPLIIPEIGINHSGILENAFKIVDSAKRAGAKIIKHQTHVPDDEMSLEAKKISPGNSKKNIYDIISQSSLSEEEEFKLFKYVESKKMVFLSTPFSIQAADLLKKVLNSNMDFPSEMTKFQEEISPCKKKEVAAAHICIKEDGDMEFPIIYTKTMKETLGVFWNENREELENN